MKPSAMFTYRLILYVWSASKVIKQRHFQVWWIECNQPTPLERLTSSKVTRKVVHRKTERRKCMPSSDIPAECKTLIEHSKTPKFYRCHQSWSRTSFLSLSNTSDGMLRFIYQAQVWENSFKKVYKQTELH